MKKEYFKLGELFIYFFRKKESSGNFSIKAMHFVNKFSICVFLAAIIYFIIKHYL